MDYRSYVSGKKNTAYKVACFLLCFFILSADVYASDITVGSNDTVYTPVTRVAFSSVTNGSLYFYGRDLSANYGGYAYLIPYTSSDIYILNPDLRDLKCNIVGSDDASFLESIKRGSGSQKVSNTRTPAVLIDTFNFSDSSHIFNLPNGYTSYYLFLEDSTSSTIPRISNVVTFSRGVSVTPTPSATVMPSAIPTPSAFPTPSGDPVPSSDPGSDSLDDYTFWATCYSQTWKEGQSSAEPFIQKFVASHVADFSDHDVRDITNYIYTYNVRIPFRITSNFRGSGLLDAYFRFSPTHQFMGFDDSWGGTKLVDASTPWIESASGCSFNAVFSDQYGVGFDIYNLPIENGATEEFYFCYNIYFCAYANFVFTGYGDYVKVTMSPILFQLTETTRVSDSLPGSVLDQINKNVIAGNDQDKQFHDEEMEEAQKAVDQLNSGLDQVTGVMSSWEIVTMPVTVVSDLVGALQSDGSTGLTFPSFSLMGYQLWPSYTFDLQVINDKFPALMNALHIITGIMVVGWFLHYLWRKWHILTGDDMPEE